MIEKLFYVSPAMETIACATESVIADSYYDGGEGLNFDYFEEYELYN